MYLQSIKLIDFGSEDFIERFGLTKYEKIVQNTIDMHSDCFVNANGKVINIKCMSEEELLEPKTHTIRDMYIENNRLYGSVYFEDTPIGEEAYINLMMAGGEFIIEIKAVNDCSFVKDVFVFLIPDGEKIKQMNEETFGGKEPVYDKEMSKDIVEEFAEYKHNPINDTFEVFDEQSEKLLKERTRIKAAIKKLELELLQLPKDEHIKFALDKLYEVNSYTRGYFEERINTEKPIEEATDLFALTKIMDKHESDLIDLIGNTYNEELMEKFLQYQESKTNILIYINKQL